MLHTPPRRSSSARRSQDLYLFFMTVEWNSVATNNQSSSSVRVVKTNVHVQSEDRSSKASCDSNSCVEEAVRGWRIQSWLSGASSCGKFLLKLSQKLLSWVIITTYLSVWMLIFYFCPCNSQDQWRYQHSWAFIHTHCSSFFYLCSFVRQQRHRT